MTDKSAIVTGAARRLGAAIAEALVEDGYTVYAHVHHADDEVPSGTTKVVADLADPLCADKIMAVAGKGPRPSLLVNNAARFAWDGKLSFDVEEFDAHAAVNLRAPIALADRFAALQRAGEDSLVVNLLDSKIAAPNADYLSYTVSKIALAGWTDLAARAYASRGVRVNGIAPGLMLQSPGQSAANFQAMHAANPLGRGVEPADVVDALRFLVGARTVTGQVLVLDSGQRFLSLDRDVQFLGNE